jgi:hypothetical protein
MRRQVRIKITFGSPMMPPGQTDRDEVRAYARKVMDQIVALRAEQEGASGSNRS